MSSRREVPGFLFGPADEVAPKLLGWHLVTSVGEAPTEVNLTEVEAYRPDDPASHAFQGIKPRNSAMFGPPGTLYVYRAYGVHWCANIVCGDEGLGAAVLVRAGLPVSGIEFMAGRRGRETHLLDGPGKLTQALGIDITHNHLDLFDPRSPVRLMAGEPPRAVRVSPRIGITKGTEFLWRFVSVP